MPRNSLFSLLTALAVTAPFTHVNADDTVYYLHSDGTEKNKIFLDTNAPTGTAAQKVVAYGVAQKRYVKLGTWNAVALAEPLTFATATDLHIWISAQNRTVRKGSTAIAFDFRAELIKNDVPIATGEITSRNIVVGSDGLTEVVIPFAPPADTQFGAGDTLGLRLLVRVSSDLPSGQKSLTWADTVTAHFGSRTRPARFGLTMPVVSGFAITSPPNLSAFNTTTIVVSGTVSNASDTVTVNRVPATVTGRTFIATVSIREGNNIITAVATSEDGTVSTASITVTLDQTPPQVTIDSPRDGAIVSESRVTVAGLINDIVVGTVGPAQARVEVNGLPAAVANRTYMVTGVPLVPGTNTITAFGTDRVGNTNSYSIRVFYNTNAADRIRIVSGNNQSGQIGQPLSLPLVVRALDTNGNPCADKKVIFKVIQNDGLVGNGAATARSLIVTSDVSGLAEVQFTLGNRAGVGNNQVSVKIVGFEGEVMFCATSTNGAAGLLVLDVGNNQVGVVGQPLPQPFRVVVVDAGFNRLANIPVSFTVTGGGGSFGGSGSTTVISDSDGRATAVLTLGPDAGNDNNQVQATFSGNTGLPVTFVASGQTPGDPEETSVSGVVLDNSDVPVPGATLRIVGHPTFVRSDANGYFQIKPAPVGAIRLVARGETVTRLGSWVWLQFDMVTIAGRDNTIGRPIRLLAKDEAQGLFVDEARGGTLTLRQVPGFSLTIASNSVTFPDRTKSGLVSVTVVHPDKMPDPPEFGQQPRFLVTIQPADAIFSPPAALCIPNLEGLKPGQKTEMYSYDHDMGQFVAIGTGTVTEDGSQICTDPGVGVVKAGWHCGGNPASVAATIKTTVSVDKSKVYVCVGQEATITATGSPTPPFLDDPFDWTTSGDIELEQMDSGATSTAKIKANSPGTGKVTVKYRCKSAQTSDPKEVEIIAFEMKDPQVKRDDELDAVFSKDPGPFCKGDKISGRVTVDPNMALQGAAIRWEVRLTGLFSDTVKAQGAGTTFSGQTLDTEGDYEIVFYCDANGNGVFDDGFLGFGAEDSVRTEEFEVQEIVDISLSIVRHVDTSFAESSFDSALSTATSVLRKKDRILTTGGDVRCCVNFARSGSLGTFGTAGDMLDVVTSEAEMNSVFAITGDFKVVTSLQFCGSMGSFNGCTRGSSMIVNGSTALATTWIHEYGHSQGLGDRTSAGEFNYIMYIPGHGSRDSVSESDCEAYR